MIARYKIAYDQVQIYTLLFSMAVEILAEDVNHMMVPEQGNKRLKELSKHKKLKVDHHHLHKWLLLL